MYNYFLGQFTVKVASPLENNFQDFKLLVTDTVCLFSKSKKGLDNKQRYSDFIQFISGESIGTTKVYLMKITFFWMRKFQIWGMLFRKRKTKWE